MAIVINGSGTVTGLSVGGLPDGTVDSGTIATGTIVDADVANVAASKLTGALPAISAANLTAIPAANITGTLPAISGANLTGLPAGGITEADTWFLDTEFSINGTNTSDLTNLSRTGNKLGTGMTESNGVLTFPSTGHWLVNFEMSYRVYTTVRYLYGYIKHSTDSGSSWGDVMNNAGNALYNNSVVYGSHTMSAVVDVTNASTHRIKFSVFANTGSSTDKIHSGIGTHMTFIKLGDT